MITKLLIISLCASAGAMTGLYFSKRLARRADYYLSAVNLINLFICEVRFKKTATKTILSDFMKSNGSQLALHLSQYVEAERPETLMLVRTVLSAGETADVKKLLLCLGTSDSETQVFELENHKLKFSEALKLAEEKRKRFSSVYIKLGFLAGTALGILLI